MMRCLVKHLLLNPFIYFSFGLGFIALGIIFMTEVPRLNGAITRVRQLESLAPGVLGAEVFVEGRISRQNSVVRQQFVSYLFEEYRSSRRTSSWVEVTRYTPPLLIDVRAGTVWIVNNDYRLEATAVTVDEEVPTFFDGASRSRGFIRGSPVLVVGTLVAEGQLDARFIYPGTRDGYLVWQENRLSMDRRMGPILVVAGIGITLLAIWLLRKWLRENKS